MLVRLRSRWGVLPTWIKTITVVVFLLGISLVHGHLMAAHSPWLTEARHLFFLPLFMASLLFGLKGGLVCALLISLNFIPALASGGTTNQGLAATATNVGLYFLTGGITGLLVDRERREATRLKQAEDLALLGQAAAAVAHELKTPLVAIGGFAQRLCRDLEDGHPHRRPLEIIVDQVVHMEQLLREMLDFSRPLELVLAPWPLGEMARECLTLLEIVAEQKQVGLNLSDAPGGAVTLADPSRVRQVILNLVQNAIQASSEGGQVVVEVAREKTWAVLRVRDQGSGIRREDQARVFSPFFTTKRQGTGLGLAISRKIALAHQGQLEFSSGPGQGSTFVLRLPLAGPLAGN